MINRLLFWDDLVLISFSEQGCQHALDRLAAALQSSKMNISPKIPQYYFSPKTQVSVRLKQVTIRGSNSTS